MISVIGIDPGTSGALAFYTLYESGYATLEIDDMPVFYTTVGKSSRARIDSVTLRDYVQLRKMQGAQLALMEAVGGRPRQSAAGGFVFGFATGQVYQCFIDFGVQVETVIPQTWKRALKVVGKSNEKAAGDIIKRADELMPHFSQQWRGRSGGNKLDRAEAAMIAYYGARYSVGNLRPDADMRLMYPHKDKGRKV